MKFISGIVVMGLIVLTLFLAALVQLFVQTTPYLLAGLLVFGIVRFLQRGRPRPGPGARVPVSVPPRQTAPVRPVTPLGSGWVLVSVWVGPDGHAHPSDVIDAEVVDDRRGRT